METRELLADAFGRIREEVHVAVAGLTAEQLAYRPDPDANSIGWLIWHLTRVQDDHVAHLAGRDQTWKEGGWPGRFGLEPDRMDLGYGHTSEQVAGIRPDGPGVLLDYHDAVVEKTLEYLDTVDAAELDRIVDTSWDPPVSAGVRLVSVLNDCFQHAGQARYVRGMIERLG
jgi:hypothetical protein